MTSPKQASTWAMVPLKSREHAKSRLATVLSPEQRAQLFFMLAERVVCTLRSTRGIDAVAVITASAEIASFAESLGAVPVLQADDFGMSAAFDLAIDELQTAQPRRVLMLPGDLPWISSSALEAVLDAASSGTGMVVVPDRHRVGTNALLCCPPRAVAPTFGGHSFERHLAAARSAGINSRVVESDALALDLDNPADLDYLRQHDATLAAQLLDTLPGANTVGAGGRFDSVAVNRR